MLPTSAMTGEGIRELKAAIHAAVLRASMPQSEVVAGTAVRCSESLRLSAASLDRARAAVEAGLGEELIAAEVRIALNELGKVAGADLYGRRVGSHLQPFLHRQIEIPYCLILPEEPQVVLPAMPEAAARGRPERRPGPATAGHRLRASRKPGLTTPNPTLGTSPARPARSPACCRDW